MLILKGRNDGRKKPLNMVKLMDKTIDNDKKVPDASRTEDFKSSILIYEVQSVLEHGLYFID